MYRISIFGSDGEYCNDGCRTRNRCFEGREGNGTGRERCCEGREGSGTGRERCCEGREGSGAGRERCCEERECCCEEI